MCLQGEYGTSVYKIIWSNPSFSKDDLLILYLGYFLKASVAHGSYIRDRAGALLRLIFS